MGKIIKWGVLATGNIAHSFVQDLLTLRDAEVVAVGSRNNEQAKKFADQYQIPKYYGDYESLAADPDVEVIYIATPHSLHYENTIMCLNQGKHVLCEKAFAINASEAENMIKLAREKNLFLMEAMWNRYQPIVKKAVSLIKGGKIGDIQLINAEFCIQPKHDPKNRLFDKNLGGGTLLDLGIYPIAFAYLLMGEPDYVTSAAKIGNTGVDEQCGIIFSYHSGCLAHLFASLLVETPSDAVVVGSKGRIRLHGPVCRPGGMTLAMPDQEDQYIKAEIDGNGYKYEAREVMECIRQGKAESDAMPLDESLAIMKTMDQIRKAWNLVYPNDIREING